MQALLFSFQDLLFMNLLSLVIYSLMVLVDSIFRIFDLSQAFSPIWESLVVKTTLNELQLFHLDVINEAIFGCHIMDSRSFLIEIHDFLIQVVLIDG